MKKAIICDIDGTIALMTDRSPYEFDKVDMDIPNKWVVDLLKAYKKTNPSVQIIFVSGRLGTDKCRNLTIGWIEKYLKWKVGVHYDLYMRPEDKPFEEDDYVKHEIFEKHIKGSFDVQFVIDDRKRVVDMWRNIAGLPVAQVAEGDF